MRRALVTVGTALSLAALCAAPASADGPVQVKSRLGDLCLDAPSAGSWTIVVINPCNGTDFQRWNFTPEQQLESEAFPGNCLTMIQQSAMITVPLWPCSNWFTQHWTAQPDGHFTGAFGACLTVLGGPNPGTWVSTRYCGAGVDQGWDLVP